MQSFLYCIKTKNRLATLERYQNITFFKDSRKAVNCAYQVNFGILFYNFHVFFWIVAIPPIPLPIVVKHQLRLDMFVWSYISLYKLCSNSPRSLKTVFLFVCHGSTVFTCSFLIFSSYGILFYTPLIPFSRWAYTAFVSLAVVSGALK